eukprot:9506050-Lingulodinium_polyedra.AAC.1
MRRPPRGGRRTECVNREMRGAAAVECVSERVPEQFSRESYSEVRSETHSIVAAPHISRCALCVDHH